MASTPTRGPSAPSHEHQETPLKAEPAVQEKLLEVQELDSRIDTLSHQLTAIPEQRQLEELRLRRTRVDNEVRDLRIRVDDLTADQKRADVDVEQVKTRRVRDQGMVDSGAISDPKALERMLDELQSLNRRIGDLEDVELEVMEQLEEAQTSLEEHTRGLGELDDEAEQLRSTLAGKTDDLEAQLSTVKGERTHTAGGLPEDLMALYERLRAQKGGVGAAALRRRECGGCRLTLNAADLAVIAKAPEDDVLRCEECNRILVRTAESGL